MKVVVNRGTGGFDLPEPVRAEIVSRGISFNEDDYRDRSNLEVISMLEECGIDECGYVIGTPRYSSLEIIDIPDGVTDFRIFWNDEYTYETLVYVVDGKIHVI